MRGLAWANGLADAYADSGKSSVAPRAPSARMWAPRSFSARVMYGSTISAASASPPCRVLRHPVERDLLELDLRHVDAGRPQHRTRRERADVVEHVHRDPGATSSTSARCSRSRAGSPGPSCSGRPCRPRPAAAGPSRRPRRGTARCRHPKVTSRSPAVSLASPSSPPSSTSCTFRPTAPNFPAATAIRSGAVSMALPTPTRRVVRSNGGGGAAEPESNTPQPAVQKRRYQRNQHSASDHEPSPTARIWFSCWIVWSAPHTIAGRAVSRQRGFRIFMERATVQ